MYTGSSSLPFTIELLTSPFFPSGIWGLLEIKSPRWKIPHDFKVFPQSILFEASKRPSFSMNATFRNQWSPKLLPDVAFEGYREKSVTFHTVPIKVSANIPCMIFFVSLLELSCGVGQKMQIFSVVLQAFLSFFSKSLLVKAKPSEKFCNVL